jgi:hypothetical protein
MKRIIEIKRGEPVPDGARWLKDYVKHIWMCPEEDATFDVFEVTTQEQEGEEEKCSHTTKQKY